MQVLFLYKLELGKRFLKRTIDSYLILVFHQKLMSDLLQKIQQLKYNFHFVILTNTSKNIVTEKISMPSQPSTKLSKTVEVDRFNKDELLRKFVKNQ